MKQLKKRECFLNECIKSSKNKTEIYKLEAKKKKVIEQINEKIVDILLDN